MGGTRTVGELRCHLHVCAAEPLPSLPTQQRTRPWCESSQKELPKVPVALLVQDEPCPSDPGGDVTHGRGFGMSSAREVLGEKQELLGQM